MYYTGSIPDHPNEFNLSHDITISVSYRIHNTCNKYVLSMLLLVLYQY